MLKVALSQVRTHARRFIAVVLAVMLGVGFLSAALIARSSMQATLEASVGSGYPKDAIVVTPHNRTQSSSDDEENLRSSVLDNSDVQRLREVPGASSAEVIASGVAQVRLDKAQVLARLVTVPKAAALRTPAVVEGSAPTQAGQASLDATAAKQYHVKIGDSVTLQGAGVTPMPGTGVQTGKKPLNATYQISGITARNADPRTGAFPTFGLTEAGMARIDQQPTLNYVLLTPPPNRSAEQFADALNSAPALTSGQRPLMARTSAAQTMSDAAQLTGGVNVLATVLILFTLLALVVSALVIANTFFVLIAQRTRELALLRCLGAQSNQIRSSVLLEALIVGAIASVLGVVLALGTLGLLVAWAHTNPNFAFTTLRVGAFDILVPILCGLILTVVAAWIPARRATKIAPLAALNPHQEATLGSVQGKKRLITGVVMLLVGLVLLVLGYVAAMLPVAFVGGLISFLGVLLGAQLLLPPFIAAVGSLIAKTGVPARMAALNAVRNPGRTTVTAVALLIGATLVSMMVTGAQITKASTEKTMASLNAVDIVVDLGSESTPESKIAAALHVPNVSAAAILTPVYTANNMPLYLVDSQAGARVINDSSIDLNRPVIWSGQAQEPPALNLPTREGTQTSVTISSTRSDLITQVIGSTGAQALNLAFDPQGVQSAPGQVGASGQAGGSGQAGAQMWVKLKPGLSTAQTMKVQEDLSAALGVTLAQIGGGALQNAMFTQVIDMLLLIVLALLAVAVLISVIGVANTLSLSILERVQENSLLRALGLTRRQLRQMLALEAILISGVAVLAGVLLGALYGFIGAGTVVRLMGPPSMELPWGSYALILGLGVLAGLFASVIPSRKAAKLSPVAGLAAQ